MAGTRDVVSLGATMNTLTGDIWQISTKQDAIVIPTNIGYRSDGRGVLGRGLALQAVRRWPQLAWAWGAFCKEYGIATSVMLWLPPSDKWAKLLLLFPVKAMNQEKPYLSWYDKARPELIEHHLKYALATFPQMYFKAFKSRLYIDGGGRVLVPSLGCGNGGLDPSVVTPLLAMYLTAPCFTHVVFPDKE